MRMTTEPVTSLIRIWLLQHRTDSQLSAHLGIDVENLPRHWAEQANLMLEERYRNDAAHLDEKNALQLKLQFYRECMQQFELAG